MKTIATIFLLTLFILISSAVAPTASAQDVLRSLDAEAVRTKYKADLEKLVPSFIRARLLVDRLEQVTSQSWTGTDWENNTQTRFSYDGDNQTENLSLVWQEDDWVNADRTTSSYEGGLLVEQQDETWVVDEWLPEFRSTYSHENNEITEAVYQEWDGDEWVNTDRTRLTSSGDVLGWEDDLWNGTEWVPEIRTTMEASGDDVTMTTEEWTGTEWLNSDRTVFLDVTVAELFEAFTDFAEDLDTYVGYGFGFGLPDNVQQTWSGTDWVDESRQQSEFDAQDRAILITTEGWEEDAWVGSLRQSRTYEDGQLEQTELQVPGEDDWQTFIVESYTYSDNGLLASVLQQTDIGFGLENSSLYTLEWTSTSVASEKDGVPVEFSLEPVYPNPFNPTANVTYHVDAPTHVTVNVYDMLGRHVATLASGVHAAGRHQVTFDAADRPSGLYIVQMKGPKHRESQTVSLIR